MVLNIFFSVLIALLPHHLSTSTTDLAMGTTTTGVGYGKPTASCDGSGICIVTKDGFDSLEDNFGMAEFTFGKGGSVTKMMALTKSMTKNTIKKHFSGKHFIMEDPFQTELETNGLKINILAGKYAIKKTKEGFIINFKA